MPVLRATLCLVVALWPSARVAGARSECDATGMPDQFQLLQSELQVRMPVLHNISGQHGPQLSESHAGRLTEPFPRHTMHAVHALHAGSKGQSLSKMAGDEEVKKTTTTTTASTLGVSLNKEGDLAAFLSSLQFNFIFILICLGLFSYLRLKYPRSYQNNVIQGFAPELDIGIGWFDWYAPVQRTTTASVAKSIGLDNAMLLEYCDMAKAMMIYIGLPMMCIVGPMNWAFGGNEAGEDKLSYLSMGNVETGSDLYYLHAMMIWYVVLVVCAVLHARQEKFVELRIDWLHTMPDNRACTVFVENIPQDLQSDNALLDFFQEMFPSKVKAAYVVRETKAMLPFYKELQKAISNREQAEHELSKTGDRPTVRPNPLGDPVDAITYYEDEVKRLEGVVLQARKRHMEEGKANGGVNLTNGFVTFYKRQDADSAMNFTYFTDQQLCVLSVPPCTTDINWSAVKTDLTTSTSLGFVGLLMVAGLFVAYLPLVIGITNLANIIDMGFLQPVWKAFAPTMGLTVMVAMLPTILLFIINFCFTLRSMDASQLKLQIWYYWFLIAFVVLATALGQDINGLFDFFEAATDVGELFSWLAETLPYSTHFFLNFMLLQAGTHTFNMIRISPLSKYIAFSKVFPDDTALKMAEPEDQDYYGKGSRSARWTVNLVIGIVYGTLSPPMNLVVFLDFWVQRNLVYGWLIPFAECKKADTGGHFWVEMCKHTYYGLGIYWILMVGVLANREADPYPHWMAVPAVLYIIYSYNRFHSKYMWEKLPYSEIMRMKKRPAPKYKFPHPSRGEYKQPELHTPLS